MQMVHRTAGWPLRAFACAAGATVVMTGCGGSGGDYKNDPRPAPPINITAFVGPKQVSVSPANFGAGPIVVIVTNQSDASQEVTFQNPGAQCTKSTDVCQSTLINPQDTGTLKLNVGPGAYEVKVGDDAIKPARVTVGRKRPSAQNELLQP
jgi:hypothetical protein